MVFHSENALIRAAAGRQAVDVEVVEVVKAPACFSHGEEVAFLKSVASEVRRLLLPNEVMVHTLSHVRILSQAKSPSPLHVSSMHHTPPIEPFFAVQYPLPTSLGL